MNFESEMQILIEAKLQVLHRMKSDLPPVVTGDTAEQYYLSVVMRIDQNISALNDLLETQNED